MDASCPARNRGEEAIRRTVVIGAVGGLAACVLALAGVTAALAPGDLSVPGNHITAGHLSVHVNHDQGSDLNFRNLAPGERRTGDQLVTVDLAGVDSASLTLRLATPNPGPLASWTSLRVSYSDPEASDTISWSGQTCTPGRGYLHHVDFSATTILTGRQDVPLGKLTADENALCVRFDIGVAATAGNDLQDADIAVDLTYILEQSAAGGP